MEQRFLKTGMYTINLNQVLWTEEAGDQVKLYFSDSRELLLSGDEAKTLLAYFNSPAPAPNVHTMADF
ncbi:MAG: hypothetical protein IH855_13895 [Bacteroidetes bacterium]|nr:hypothetical protein [Bacteroidota bacterium]